MGYRSLSTCSCRSDTLSHQQTRRLSVVVKLKLSIFIIYLLYRSIVTSLTCDSGAASCVSHERKTFSWSVSNCR